MRITHSDGERLVVLNDAEASALTEACALLAVASQSMSNAFLPPEMAQVLGHLFEGLRASTQVTGATDQNHRAIRHLEK